MNTKPYIRNSNTHTSAQIAIEELDNKILDFINTTVIPKLMEDRQLTDGEFKKLNHILYYAIALDVYTKKNVELFRVLSGNKNEKNFNIFSKKMTKNLEKALSLVSCDDIFLGMIKGVNTSSKYAKKYHSIKKQKGIVKLFEKSIIHSLEKLACHKDLKSIFQSSHHVKTVLKLREYILQGGKIENLNIDSTSFANLVQQVKDLKGNFSRNNQYLTFVRNEDDTLSYQQTSGKKKEMTGREESHIQKSYLVACRAEDFFMASQLISLYSEKLGNLMKEYVPQPENSIKDTISTKITQFFQRKEYERIARTIAEEWGPIYVYKHGGLKNTVRDFEIFLAVMKNEMMENENLNHTTAEDYTQYIEKYYVSKIKQQEAEAKRQREILQMTPMDVQKKLNEINLKWGVPLGTSIACGVLSSAGAFSMLPFPTSLSAIGSIGGVAATGVLYSIGRRICLENDIKYWNNVKTIIEQNEKSIPEIEQDENIIPKQNENRIQKDDEKPNPSSPIRRRRKNTIEPIPNNDIR